jgi:hypothetical protein
VIRRRQFAGALAALAIFTACSGGVPSTTTVTYQYIGKTLSVNGRLVTAARLSPLPRYATLVPDWSATKTFEYIINIYGSYAGIFDYPKSDKEIGRIPNVGGQGCTNVLYGYGKRTFWIVAGASQITEYAAPKKPIKTLAVAAGQPSSCAMNASGDLAVGNLTNGDIVIFKDARGSGTVMTTPLGSEFFDGYDGKGNLFADGFNDTDVFTLIELPKGTSKFRTITTSNTVRFPGSVQWDGTYLTILDQGAAAIYRYTIGETRASLKGTVSLRGASDCAQSWIAKALVYCADAANNDGEVFKYPAGGSIVAIFSGSFDFPLGTTAVQK